jgi:hypothetical protein
MLYILAFETFSLNLVKQGTGMARWVELHFGVYQAAGVIKACTAFHIHDK